MKADLSTPKDPNAGEEVKIELTLRKGQLWMKTIGIGTATATTPVGSDSSGLGVFHNGSEVVRAKEIPLRGEDVITFQSERGDCVSMAGNAPKYGLVVREFLPQLEGYGSEIEGEGEEELSGSDFEDADEFSQEIMDPFVEEVFSKSEICSKILAFLSLDDLKEVRLVSKNFYAHCQPQFLKKAFVSLQPDDDCSDWDKEFRRYCEQDYGHQNFRVMYSGHPCDGFLEEDVLYFMKNYGNQIKTLELTMMPGRNDFAFLRDIFSAGLCNLEDLSVTLCAKESNYVSKYLASPMVLPSVTALTLSFAYSDTLPDYMTEFAPSFVSNFPNLSNLKVTGSDETCESIVEEKILQQIIVGLAEENSFRNLNQIRLQWANVSVIGMLIDFPTELKVIDVHFERSVVDTHLLQELIDRHSGSLEELALTVHGKEVVKGEPQIVMPALSKLKKLSYVFYIDGEQEDECKEMQDMQRDFGELADIDLLNMSGVFKENKMNALFPALTSLELVFTGRLQHWFEKLFPDSIVEHRTFPQIHTLRMEFPTCPNSSRPQMLWIKKIATMFPNANSAMFKLARRWVPKGAECNQVVSDGLNNNTEVE